MTDHKDAATPLPEPDYPAGSTGMLGEDCYSRSVVLRLLAAERAKLDAEIARLNAHEDYNQLIISKAAEKITGLEALLTQVREALSRMSNYMKCTEAVFSQGRMYLDMTLMPQLAKDAESAIAAIDKVFPK